MINILLCGCGGRMGKAIAEFAENAPNKYRILAGVDINAATLGAVSTFPVYSQIDEVTDRADVIVDFSHHSAIHALLTYATRTGTPLVVATTGHTEEEHAKMREASEQVPVFFSRNMSLGINLLIELCKTACTTLGEEFDVEIIERHHNQKLDAPSGTALMIADAIRDISPEQTEYVYDRHEVRRKRTPAEIGIHAVRGGTIVGEHEVMFAGKDEVITLSHHAASREVFALGALRAAAFMAGKPAGFYRMSDLVKTL